jgi:hypothetical protein
MFLFCSNLLDARADALRIFVGERLIERLSTTAIQGVIKLELNV